jgi:hypothetical protein
MEDRSCVGYAFKQDIEDSEIDDDGNVRYDFSVFETLEAAEEARLDDDPDDAIIRVRVTIEEIKE